MKVTLVPEQIEVELAVIETEGVTVLVVMAITFEVAVDVVVQLAFEVMITVTWSLLARELVVNVEEFVPAFTPLICH